MLGAIVGFLALVAMLVFCLLVLLASTVHAAQESIAARTQVAIGLVPLQLGIGLWLARPKTWVGVEFNNSSIAQVFQAIPSDLSVRGYCG